MVATGQAIFPKTIYVDIESQPEAGPNEYIVIEEIGHVDDLNIEYLVRYNDHTIQETFTMPPDSSRLSIVEEALALVRDCIIIE